MATCNHVPIIHSLVCMILCITSRANLPDDSVGDGQDEEENDDANDRGSSYNDLGSSDSTLVAWDILKAHLRLKHRKA